METCSMQVGNLENAKNATDPEIKAFLAFVKDNKAESDLTREIAKL